MKRNRLITLVIAGIMGIGLVGCGAKEEVAKKGGQIEYWHVAAENFGGESVRTLIDEFNKENSDIEVKEKYNADMYKGLTQNLQASLASGKSPELVQMGYSYLNYSYENMEFVDPFEVVEKYFPEDKEFLEKNMTKEVLELGQVNGKQVGIPYSISNPILYYNMDLLKEAGIKEAPKTWKDMMEVVKQVKEKTGKYGLFMQEFSDNWAQQAMMESNGGKMLGEVDGKTQATFASKESAEPYDELYKMIKDKQALHANNEEGMQSFLNGEVAMCITTVGKRANFEKSAKFQLSAAEFPEFENKVKKVPAGGNFLVILAKDEEGQKSAWKFIKHLLSPKSVAEWSTGTGYLPPTTNYEEGQPEFKKFMEENKIMSAAMGQMDNISQWASFPGKNGLQAEQILIDTRDIILSGKEPAEKALKDAQDKINQLIK